MKETYRHYLSALRSFLHGTAPEALSPEALHRLLELAMINSTGGIVAYAYRTHPDRTDPQTIPALKKLCFQEISLYSRRAELMKLLLEKLNSEEIDTILFKGFVIRDYYTVPELRTFGDVDFVVRSSDRKKSDALMKKLGYTPQDTWEPAYSYLKMPEYYEIHTSVMDVDVSDKADYPGYFSRIWDHVRPSTLFPGKHILEFTPEFHFLYLLTHIAKHISSSGAGIRMYLDIAFFLKQLGETLDWTWIARELKVLRFEDFANVIFTATERWFGIESPLPLRPVPEQVMTDFLEFTLEGGVYGRANRDQGVVFLKQQGRNEEEVSRVKTLMFHAFPPVRVLQNKYPYLQKHRALLPVAWVQRLADSRSEWSRFADHTKTILTADSEEVLKLKRIYKELGL